MVPIPQVESLCRTTLLHHGSESTGPLQDPRKHAVNTWQPDARAGYLAAASPLTDENQFFYFDDILVRFGCYFISSTALQPGLRRARTPPCCWYALAAFPAWRFYDLMYNGLYGQVHAAVHYLSTVHFDDALLVLVSELTGNGVNRLRSPASEGLAPTLQKKRQSEDTLFMTVSDLMAIDVNGRECFHSALA